MKHGTRRTKPRSFSHNQLGVTFFQSGAIELAVEQFTLAKRRAAWVSTYWLNLGVALLEQNELDKAEAALSRALKLNPQSQSAHFHLAQIHTKRGDETAARNAYQQVITLDPLTRFAQRAREHNEGWRPRLIGAIED